ncbi:unnamed protein product, partial [Brassica rapa subsp. trilocularis]
MAKTSMMFFHPSTHHRSKHNMSTHHLFTDHPSTHIAHTHIAHTHITQAQITRTQFNRPQLSHPQGQFCTPPPSNTPNTSIKSLLCQIDLLFKIQSHPFDLIVIFLIQRWKLESF